FSKREARSGRCRFPSAIARGEETAGQWVVGDDPKPLIPAQRQQLAFDLAVEQIVSGLHTIEGGQVQPATDAQCQGNLPGRVVRAAKVANLTLADQVVKRA